MRTVRQIVVIVFALLLSAIVGVATAIGQTYTISPPPFLLAQDNSGKIINNACIWTYTAGTTTPATTYTTSTGVANTNPIRSDSAGRFTAYLSPGSAYKFVYESACTPPSHGTTLRTADNISAMPSASGVVDVSGTAGESINAGQCVYLSAGDGGKTQGQWYKCDNTNAYSSTTNWVGIATVNISSAGTGTIRIVGSVSGLSLSVGSVYYVGTGGALTSTAPGNNVRKLGEADTATSLVLKDRDAPTLPFVDDFRLSLTTATCITSTDVTAATTLFFTPCTGNRITLFSTTGVPETCTTNEISIAVPATTTQMYDVWAYDSTFGSCTVTLELLAWTNDTTRATALARTNGRWAKSGDTSRLYVGSFRTTGVSGQTEDSLLNRFVWNYYNRTDRTLRRIESTASWNYTTHTIRQANGSTSNQVNMVIGVSEDPVYLQVSVTVSSAGGNNLAAVGIGLDSTTTFATSVTDQAFMPAGSSGNLHATYRDYPGIGKHSLMWNEDAWASGVTLTWYGTSTAVGGGGPVTASASGMAGYIKG